MKGKAFFKDMGSYAGFDHMSSVFTMDKATLYHYRGAEGGKPVLLLYALINKPYIMDFEKDESFAQGLLEEDLDVYLLDWGDPTRDEKYLTLDNYIQWYLHGSVKKIYERTGQKVTLVMLCQGGVLGSIYAALYPEYVAGIVAMATPIDFDSMKASVFSWAVEVKGDAFIKAFGMVPPSLLNTGLLFAKPFEAFFDRYGELFRQRERVAFVEEFMRMERWNFDSPAQASEALLQWLNDVWREDRLKKGTLEIAGKRVDLKNITVPVFVIEGTKDDFTPKGATESYPSYLGSTDVHRKEYNSDHLGLVASPLAKNVIAKDIAAWIQEKI